MAENKELTIEEKNEAIMNWCASYMRDGCVNSEGKACPLHMYHDVYCYGPGRVTEEKIIRNYETLLPFLPGGQPDQEEAAADTDQDVHDAINHPEHYTDGAMECIDEMVLVFGKDAVKDFCKCNVWKYRYRAMSKGGREDLKKADWYMQKYKELSQ